MKKKTIQKTWHSTAETEKEIDLVLQELCTANESAAIRYCIHQVFKQLQKEVG